jgi:hypothetical protein
MSHFLADAYKKTVTLKQHVYTQIQNKERHHITMSTANIEVNDVIVFQSESDEMMNTKHPEASRDTWTMITTKESYSMGGKTLCVYGFITLEGLPQKLVEMANGFYKRNGELVQEQIDMVKRGVEML